MYSRAGCSAGLRGGYGPRAVLLQCRHQHGADGPVHHEQPQAWGSLSELLLCRVSVSSERTPLPQASPLHARKKDLLFASHPSFTSGASHKLFPAEWQNKVC